MVAGVIGHPGLYPWKIAVPALDGLSLFVVMLVEMLAIDAQRGLRGQLRLVKGFALFLSHVNSSLQSRQEDDILSSCGPIG